ncbi:MAG TPA: alpha-amylase family glycosyl hydrolase [Gaiellaceae bacterium]|nr:alpha-amylase family glycosyl hydrolase [Gaiellaceae bacterium]
MLPSAELATHARPDATRSRFCRLAALGCVGLLVLAGTGGAEPHVIAQAPTGAALDALSQPPTYSAFASQRIYFVMPDRYANGDPSNDRGGLTGPRSVTGYDPVDSGWYHGGDLKGLTGVCADTRTGLARVENLGFTAIWVTPVVAQQYVQADSAAYHGYWGLDFTKVDPHLGTNADFEAFVDCAHSLGLKVYLDVVVNHTADVILPAGGSTYRSAEEMPYRDCKGNAFSAQRYAGTKRFPCLSARYQPRQPLVLPQNRNLKKPAWLNQVTRYHNRGSITFDSCSPACFEQGDFFGLDDVFTEQPFVVNGLAEVFGGWIREFGVDGFRVDTAKHVDRAFFKAWAPRIQAAARAAGVRDFEIFGEVFLTDSVELSMFVRDRAIPNVIDFPLQDTLVRYAGGSAGSRGIASRLADDDYFRGPSGVAPTPATFLGNHDVGRAAAKIREQTQAEGAELLARVELGHSLLYLLRGVPTVYYGDEVGMIGRGGDKAARQDMFPTQVDEWKSEARVGSPPIGTGSSFDLVDHPVSEHLRALGALRDAHPALSTGGSIVRLASGGTLAVSRIDREARREYLALFNAAEEPARLTVQTATPDASWIPLLGGVAATSAANGRVTITVPPLTALLLRADAELPKRGAAKATLKVKSDEISSLVRVSATASTLDPLSVTFAVRRAGASSWTRLGVDDSGPYAVYLDPRPFKKGERISLVAIVRASDGSISTSPVISVRPR